VAFSTRFLLFIGTGTILVFMFGYVTVGHSVDPFHILHYLWMALYFIVAMAVTLWAEMVFQNAATNWSSPSRAARYSKLIGGYAIKALVIWLAFWHPPVFVWIVFALALTALLRIGFRDNPLY
jgi:hypothetical protein